MGFKGIKERLTKAQRKTYEEETMLKRAKLERMRKQIHKINLKVITENKLNPNEAIILMYIKARGSEDTSITRMANAFYGHLNDVKSEVRNMKRILKKLKKKELIDYKEREEIVKFTIELNFSLNSLYLSYKERELLNTPCRTCSLLLIYMMGWKRDKKEWIRVPNVKMAKDLGVSERTVASALKKLDSMLIIKRNTYFKMRYIYFDD